MFTLIKGKKAQNDIHMEFVLMNCILTKAETIILGACNDYGSWMLIHFKNELLVFNLNLGDAF